MNHKYSSVFLVILLIFFIAVIVTSVDFPCIVCNNGNLEVTANVTAEYFIGNGSLLTDINVTGADPVTDIWVNVTGDTMTGLLNMSSANITLSKDYCITWPGGASICHNGTRMRLTP